MGSSAVTPWRKNCSRHAFMRCITSLLVVTLYVAGCGVSSTPAVCETDLPEGWSCDSSLMVTQSECSAQAMDLAKSPTVRRSENRRIVVSDATFRCGQSICAYLDAEPSTSRVLLQPCDMNPEAPAKCDCSSTLSIALPEGATRVEVYARGDSQSGRDNPALFEPSDVTAEAKVLCDGSEKLRFSGTDAGGNLTGVPRVVAEVGWSFLLIDGQCQYWSMVRPEGPIRTGTLSAQQELDFTSALQLGRWSDQALSPTQGCPDASTTTFRFLGEKASLSCESTQLTESYGDWLTLLHDSGTDLTGPVRYSVGDPGDGGWPDRNSNLASSWPLVQSPTPLLAPSEDEFAEPVQIAGADADALRQLRNAYLAEMSNGRGPWLRIPMEVTTEDGSPRYFDLALRDVISFERDGRLAPDDFFGL